MFGSFGSQISKRLYIYSDKCPISIGTSLLVVSRYIFFLCALQVFSKAMHNKTVIVHASNRAMERMLDFNLSCWRSSSWSHPCYLSLLFHFRLLLNACRLSIKLSSLHTQSLTNFFWTVGLSFPDSSHYHPHDPPWLGQIRRLARAVIFIRKGCIEVQTAVHDHKVIITTPRPTHFILSSSLNIFCLVSGN